MNKKLVRFEFGVIYAACRIEKRDKAVATFGRSSGAAVLLVVARRNHLVWRSHLGMIEAAHVDVRGHDNWEVLARRHGNGSLVGRVV